MSHLESRSKLEKGEQITVVFLGDSNTEHTFHTQDKLNVSGWFSTGIFHRYGVNRAKVVNAGSCGDTATRGLERFERDALALKPDLVFIGYGMNDASGGEDGIGIFKNSLVEMITKLNAISADVVLRTPNPVILGNNFPKDEEIQAGEEWHHHRVDLYAEAAREVAAEQGCNCVDHYTLWKKTQYEVPEGVQPANGLWTRMSDSVHPGACGHRAFYNELAPLHDLPTRFPWEE